jgi:hypothetical protein
LTTSSSISSYLMSSLPSFCPQFRSIWPLLLQSF